MIEVENVQPRVQRCCSLNSGGSSVSDTSSFPMLSPGAKSTTLSNATWLIRYSNFDELIMVIQALAAFPFSQLTVSSVTSFSVDLIRST